MDKYYNVHDIVSFRVIDSTGPAGRLAGDWDIELRGFESERRNSVDFTVVMGKFSPDHRGCAIIDDDYYIRENYFYGRDSCQYARWRLEISGLEQGETTVRIDSNLPGRMLIPELLINPIIWLKLSEKGYAIVHGSAVSRDGRAYIFAGRGAAGKTTIALSLVEQGYKLLSEHFVILGRGRVLSFPAPLHIMDYNLVPALRRNMSSKHKASFQLRQLLRQATGKRLATKVLPRDIIPDLLVDEAALHSVFLLLPRAEFRATKIGKGELIGHLVNNQRIEAILFVKYMMEYAYLFPRSRMASYWARYEQNLSQVLGMAEAFYRVEVPPSYENGTLGRISGLLRECGGFEEWSR